MSTLYDELEVSSKASPEIIQAAYRSLIQRYHPDRNPGSCASAQRTQRVNGAYAVLSDPDKRVVYDAKLVVEQRLRQDEEDPQRRAANEAAARAEAATAELRRRMEAAARARTADRQKAIEVEQKRRATRERELIQMRAEQRHQPTKAASKRGGFMGGFSTLILWGLGFWIGGELLSANHRTLPSEAKAVAAAAATRSPQAQQTFACRMWMGSEYVVGDISVDFRANTVDGKPAKISASTIFFGEEGPDGNWRSSINRQTGAIATTWRAKAGNASTFSGHCAPT